MKKKWINPLVFNQSESDPGNWTGNGSGTATPDEEPWDWEFWMMNYEEDDSDGNGVPGEYSDYVAWMHARGWDEYITEP